MADKPTLKKSAPDKVFAERFRKAESKIRPLPNPVPRVNSVRRLPGSVEADEAARKRREAIGTKKGTFRRDI